MKTISTFVVTILMLSFLVLSFPESGNAQSPSIPSNPAGCCQYDDNGQDECTQINAGLVCPVLDIGPAIDFLPGGTCNNQTQVCMPMERNVPALSQWGLISLVVILAIISLGAMSLKRKRNTV